VLDYPKLFDIMCHAGVLEITTPHGTVDPPSVGDG